MLRAWLDAQVLPAFAGRILAVDVAVAQRCARLHVPDRRSELDALIAATALLHSLTVVTRNGRVKRPFFPSRGMRMRGCEPRSRDRPWVSSSQKLTTDQALKNGKR